MTSPADLPLSAWLCTGCGWLNRGITYGGLNKHPGDHNKLLNPDQTEHGSASNFGRCEGKWVDVIVSKAEIP